MGRCIHPACTKYATFGDEFLKVALYCVTHKEADHVDLKHKQCQHPGCTKRPNFGIEGTNQALYCVTHKEADHINLISERCKHTGCKKRPAYGIEGTNQALYCVTHKEADHVDLINKRCQHPGCKKIPNYGIEGTNQALYCATHKEADHVDLKNKRCQHLGCKKQPVFGIEETNQALYCVTHKEADHVDLKNKRCQHPGCKKKPVYGIEGTNQALYCVTHKEADHVDLMSKRCQHPGCKKIPNYGIEGTCQRLYCITHKEADHVNVKDKQCQHPGCKKRPNYGLPGCEPIRCKSHILPNMIENPRKRCEKCTNLGIWGTSLLVRRCDTHKQKDDKNLLENQCLNCNLPYVLDSSRMCQTCSEFTAVKRNFLEKQKAVKIALEPEFDIETYDQIIDRGICSKRRPDFVINGLYRKVIIEVDEHQHKRGVDYSPDCEYRRMWDIIQALGMPCTFIRFNPDAYKTQTRHDPPLSQRCEALIGWIKTLQRRELDLEEFASVVYLYYDGFTTPEDAEKIILKDVYVNGTPMSK